MSEAYREACVVGVQTGDAVSSSEAKSSRSRYGILFKTFSTTLVLQASQTSASVRFDSSQTYISFVPMCSCLVTSTSSYKKGPGVLAVFALVCTFPAFS